MPPRIVCALALALAACASKQSVREEDAPAPEKVAPLASDLPRGSLHRTSRGADFMAMIDEVAGASVVYVGETRGNPDHHLLQLRVVEYLLDRGRLHAVGLDAVERGDQARLDAWLRGEGEALPAPAGYAGLLRLARERRLPVLALGVPDAEVARFRELGADGIPEDVRRTLPALPAGASLRHEIAAGILVEWFRTAPDDAQVVVLAPTADVAGRGGLVQRVRERSGKIGKVVLPIAGAPRPEQLANGYADFVWFTPE